MTGAERRLLGSEFLIKQADPEVVEEWKWRGVPVLVSRWNDSAPGEDVPERR